MANQIVKEREQYVVKANELIRKTRYNLTTQQQKIVLYLISKIKPDDKPDTEYQIDIVDFCRTCGFSVDDGGMYYTNIKRNLRALTARQWCIMPNGDEMTISWIGDCKIVKGTGKVSVRFNPNLSPYLFELRERYTQYKLVNVLAFKGKYAIRLYEILRSYTTQDAIDRGYKKEIYIPLEQLRDVLACESFPYWADFNRFVLKKAVEEINLLSDDIYIEYESNKALSNSVKGVNFIIYSATAKQRIQAHQERKKRLD